MKQYVTVRSGRGFELYPPELTVFQTIERAWILIWPTSEISSMLESVYRVPLTVVCLQIFSCNQLSFIFATSECPSILTMGWCDYPLPRFFAAVFPPTICRHYLDTWKKINNVPYTTHW
jgi:hypothetical protein